MTTTSAPHRLSLPDGSLHVDFIWQGDRFVHEFVLIDGSRLGSVEGSADQAWPPSPPLQQLSRELIDDSYVILGVGAAGQSHWSISVEITSEGRRQTLKFDLACRSKTDPEWLGSSYRESEMLRFDPAFGSTMANEDGKIVIRPPQLQPNQTIRWGYQVSARSA